MHFENETPRRNIYRQFSLSMLLLLVTGIACYLGGHMHGYRQGIAIWDAAPKVPFSYGVADLITNPKFDAKALSPVDLLAQQIKNDVMPGVWHDNGASLRVMRENSVLVVVANHLVHEAVASYLKNARSRAPAAAEK